MRLLAEAEWLQCKLLEDLGRAGPREGQGLSTAHAPGCAAAESEWWWWKRPRILLGAATLTAGLWGYSSEGRCCCLTLCRGL
ncbi:hypothetical protein NPIL_43931 [Nephila pilipes]|uniref:Uncharacterized protein n=1 Tax=Nephila pilipes TaxID=299642 RepID=A0A8X6INB9_NEPPI|nr:hypothetical protein NPIL_43931 [Nephila pilipes]